MQPPPIFGTPPPARPYPNPYPSTCKPTIATCVLQTTAEFVFEGFKAYANIWIS
jgi:hypothetical protein